MVRFVVSVSAPAGAAVALILDQIQMVVVSGVAGRIIKTGDHRLDWLIVNPGGGKYTLNIISPESAKGCSSKDIFIPSDGKEAGTCTFTVD